MRTVCLSVLSLLASLSGCGSGRDSEDGLAEKIEKFVILPRGAAPLDSYGRYYAKRNGTILAVYTNHSDEYREFVKQDCRMNPERTFPCPLDDGRLRLVNAGQRMWLDDWRTLPATSGGGCGHVTFEYEPASNRFFHVECNGDY
jgi:hypothetical protein